MRRDQIEKLFRKLGSYNFRTNDKGIMTNCPFYFMHKDRSDSAPSMFVWATDPRDKGFSTAYCHACLFKGGLEKLIWEVRKVKPDTPIDLLKYAQDLESGIEDFDDLINIPSYNEIPNYVKNNKRAAKVHKSGNKKSKQVVLLDGSTFDWVDHGTTSTDLSNETIHKMVDPCLGKVPQYWFDRGFTIEEAKLWRVGLMDSFIYKVTKHEENKVHYVDMGQRLLFPIYDYNQVLVGWSGRALKESKNKENNWVSSQYHTGDKIYTSNGAPKYYHCPVFERNNFLYGEHLLNSKLRIGILTEGFFDVINLKRLGYQNVVASMGTHLSQEQQTKILNWFDTLIVFPDGDNAGTLASKKIKEQLQDFKIDLRIVDNKIYDGRDPGDLTLNETIDCFQSIHMA